jgi:hypothetical protein
MIEKRQPLQKYFRENRISACRNLKLDPCLPPSTSISSKLINDLNIRPKTHEEMFNIPVHKKMQTKTMLRFHLTPV